MDSFVALLGCQSVCGSAAKWKHEEDSVVCTCMELAFTDTLSPWNEITYHS
jgi:hypothetical protein